MIKYQECANHRQTLSELELVELDLLVQGLHRVHRVDLSAYAPASLQRRMRLWLHSQGLTSFAAALHPLLRDPSMVQTLLQYVTVGVTEMFRDPDVFKLLRSKVVPQLATSANIRIWHAGCSSGEEVYSMAILLREAGLNSRSRLYGTDINEVRLECARRGIYDLDNIHLAAQNYQASGGSRDFSDYYRIHLGRAVMDPILKCDMFFANHNAVSDADFAEMDLICCRNMMIYYGNEPKSHCLNLIDSSLRVGGFLVLGTHETLEQHAIHSRYEELGCSSRVYRKLRAAA